MIERTAFCSCQLWRMSWMRFGPIPLTSARKAGLSSITARCARRRLQTIFFAKCGPTPLTQPGTQVAGDSLDGVRRGGAERVGLELRP